MNNELWDKETYHGLTKNYIFLPNFSISLRRKFIWSGLGRGTPWITMRKKFLKKNNIFRIKMFSKYIRKSADLLIFLYSIDSRFESATLIPNPPH